MRQAPSNKYKAQGNQPAFDVPSEMHRILGVDPTAIPGMSAQGVLTFFCEVGHKSPFSFLPALCFLAGALSGQPHQWRQNPLFQNPQRALPACECLTHGRDHFVSQPLELG